MNCRDQARKIYELCVFQAKEQINTLTYMEVLKILGYQKGVSGQAIRYGLELVLIACAENGLPILTSIIVNQLSGSPSPDAIPGKPWEEEGKKVFDQKEWPGVDEIDWDYIWDNRKRLSDKHGTPGYWGN